MLIMCMPMWNPAKYQQPICRKFCQELLKAQCHALLTGHQAGHEAWLHDASGLCAQAAPLQSVISTAHQLRSS